MKITTINAATDTVIEREPTEAELEQFAKDNLQQLEIETKKAQAEAAKVAAQAKLTALGLTTDDLKALGL